MSLRERLEALAKDWETRRYASPYSRESLERIAHNEGRDEAIHDAAAELRAVLTEHKDDR